MLDHVHGDASICGRDCATDRFENPTLQRTKPGRKPGRLLLTDTDGGEEPGGDEWRQAVLEGRLQDVVGERERDDGQRGGIHDEDGAP